MNTNGSIIKEENSIKNEKVEHLRIFNTDGKLLYKKKGTKSKISLTDDQLSLLPDSITSHNHPNGSSLSLDDVIITLSMRIKEAHVVTSHNITYVLEITDDTVYEYIDYKIMEDEYQRLYNEYYRSMILGSSRKNHKGNYQKLFSQIMYDLFENIEGIDYYEIGEYKE